MKNAVKSVFILAVLCVFAGCRGPRVQVPPGYVGKVLSPSGYENGVRGPSSFRLPYSPPWGAPYRLVLAEASDTPRKESIQVFMPKDRLNLDFDIRMTFSVPNDERVDVVYGRLTPGVSNNSDVLTIDSDAVYETYVQPIVRDVCRQVAARYDIEQMLTNRESISAEMAKEVRSALKERPVDIANFGFADMQPPKVIVDAQVIAKEREVGIRKAEAERVIALTEAETKLEVAKRQQEIDLLEAETQARVDQVLANAVSPAFITQRSLRALEELSKSNNRIIFLPMEAMRNPGMLIGAMNEAKETK